MNMHPFYFDAQGRRLLGILHPAIGAMRGMVLICPPLLHEHVRSYRFFSMLAGRLAASGLACLRFDYSGTGDSAGDDADFSPDLALSEIVRAADELRGRAGAGPRDGHPMVLMGVRMSALFVLRAASAARADALWLWQPVLDGRSYVAALETLDLEARSCRHRYPLRDLPVPAGPDELMGFRVSASFRDEIASHSVVAGGTRLPVAVVTGANTDPPPFTNASHHVLPESAVDWVDEIDFRSVILPRDAEPVVQALLQGLPAATQEAAHG